MTREPGHDLYLDLRGLACPLPVLKTRKALQALADGRRVLVEATDPLAAIDIPHFVEQAGHRLISAETTGTVFRCIVEKV
ncbi:MAG: sulfurtransferase TusA family protein [Hyphomicrobiales bacterium]|nr:sulfurtransferase TusA family protein [Hyphomicrobiales bacterium]